MEVIINRIKYMKLLITPHQLAELKSRDFALVCCEYCNNPFKALVKDIRKALAGSTYIKVKYCSKQCSHKAQDTRQTITCITCGKTLIRAKKKITQHTFCSRQCSGKYNAANKSHGYSRSKLEIWLEQKIKAEFPNLSVICNNRDIINSELDLYIPSLKLAFELNGIFHYEPIYGFDTLYKIQNNDTRKFQACLDHGIELCIIDSSQQKRFTEKSSEKYFEIIRTVISQKQQFV